MPKLNATKRKCADASRSAGKRHAAAGSSEDHARADDADDEEQLPDVHSEATRDGEMMFEDAIAPRDETSGADIRFEVEGGIVFGSATDQFGLVGCDIYMPNSQWPEHKKDRRSSRCRVEGYAEKAPNGPSYVVSYGEQLFAFPATTLASLAHKHVQQPTLDAKEKLQGKPRHWRPFCAS